MRVKAGHEAQLHAPSHRPMSSPGYSSARLRPRRAGLRFTRYVQLINGPIPTEVYQIGHNFSFTPPAYGRSGVRHERWPELAMRRLNGTWEPEISMLTEKLQVEDPQGREYGCGISGAECPVVVMKRGNARGAKGTGHSRHDRCGQPVTGGTARLLRRERQLS